jgi:hypothetical protein
MLPSPDCGIVSAPFLSGFPTMSTPDPRAPGPAFPDASDGGQCGRLSIDDLEARYAAATLALWNARRRYLQLCEQQPGGHPEGLGEAYSEYVAARSCCAQLLSSIEAIEGGA